MKAPIMNPQRFATVATALTVVVAGCAVAWLADLGSAGVDNIGAAPIVDRRAPPLTADVDPADAPQAIATGKAGGANTVVAAAAAVPETTTNTTAAQDEPEPIAEAAPPTAAPTQPPDTPPVQVATASTSDPLPIEANRAVGSIEIPDACQEGDVCIDQYLWALYRRTPKEDTIKVNEQRKVVVKKKGKRVTVTQSFTKLLDEDFTWKDPKAAEKAGMPMMDYVIGGMDRSFKVKLFHALRAADEAGLSPGITSAFRDNYRQSLASGLKAATDRSYHGGSFRGGYGHGLAADVVSVKGETRDQRYGSSEALWKWIDAHGEEFGIGRPYLDRDPPHVAPIDGTEYAAHHRGTEARHEGSKKRSRLAVRDSHNVGKRSKTARSSKQRTI
ncbi:peptidase M15 [Bradyrhizobium sp. Tv2a-2]|uniref:peptidase M15 n=1 Tax=Bradyrhizobium sp. Tv2a-2 TaxID=113395 RepID=UPI001FD87DE7|nr:peptidase M15 [Bradyrhizobium sp. Tv2a-2]